MKNKKITLYILMYLPLLIVLIALPFLPDSIPAHYGFDGEITRWGSKYEALIYPIVTIFMGYFLLIMSKYAAKQEENGKNNEKVLLIAGIVVLIYFNAMNLFSLYTDFNRITNLSDTSVNLFQLVFGLVGLIMIVIGNVMPKLRMNSLFGLRTPWSMKNEETWKRSQHFGGISLIVAGVLLILNCFLTRGMVCTVVGLLILFVFMVADTVYTYFVAKRYA